MTVGSSAYACTYSRASLGPLFLIEILEDVCWTAPSCGIPGEIWYISRLLLGPSNGLVIHVRSGAVAWVQVKSWLLQCGVDLGLTNSN